MLQNNNNLKTYSSNSLSEGESPFFELEQTVIEGSTNSNSSNFNNSILNKDCQNLSNELYYSLDGTVEFKKTYASIISPSEILKKNKVEPRDCVSKQNLGCEYYLPNYIKYDSIDNKFLYKSDRSANGHWLKTSSIREAEHKSGHTKKQWVLCPLYKADPNKIGYKFVPRNDSLMIKNYLNKFYPGCINLKENETIDDVRKIWVYEGEGYFSYPIDSKKKNLERNCTDGANCSGAKDGSCPYNHQVENGESANLCKSDKNDLKFSSCLKSYCPCDHKVNRVAIHKMLKTMKILGLDCSDSNFGINVFRLLFSQEDNEEIDKLLGGNKICEVINTKDNLDDSMINRYPNLSMSKKPEYNYHNDFDSETDSVSDVTDSLDAETVITDSDVEIMDIDDNCAVFPDIDDNAGFSDYDSVNVDDKSSFNEVVSVAMNPFTPVGIGERKFFNSPLNCY
tara:strand:+ start:1650 stop:3005 length:1356 start_codon:yes stop_codon:yes gene_type:complete